MGRIYYLFFLLIAFLLSVIYDQYDAFLLSAVFFLTPFLLYFPGKWIGRGMDISLSCPAHTARGDTMEIVAVMKSPFLSFLASPEVLLDGAPYESYEEDSGVIRFYFTKNAFHCGRESTGKALFSWADPFGLFRYKKELPPSSFLVYPKEAGNYQTALSNLRKAADSDEKEYFGAVAYKPGDNPRLINWKITARKEDVYVRDSTPANSEKIVLAADYEENEELRDTVGDALLSLGLALLSVSIPFRFFFVTEKEPVSLIIHNREEWMDALSAFLRAGKSSALQNSSLSPYIPVCYLTGNPDSPVPPLLHPSIWCASPGAKRAAFSGKDAIYEALGGKA